MTDWKSNRDKALHARHVGLSSSGRELVATFNAKQEDWTGTCRHCGAKLTGTLQTLKAHQCAVHDGS